jgi:hypothetical protein
MLEYAGVLDFAFFYGLDRALLTRFLVISQVNCTVTSGPEFLIKFVILGDIIYGL